MVWILFAIFVILPLALGISAFRAAQRNKASLARAEQSLQELKDRVALLEARGILRSKSRAQYQASFEPAPSLTPEDFEAQTDSELDFEASERYSPPAEERQPELAVPAYRLPKAPHEIAPPVKEPVGPQSFEWRKFPGISWLLGGNTLVRVGVVVLFFGLAFLLKYAAERLTFPPELRLGLVALGGFGLLGLGWKLRTSRPGYGLSLQGGGIGVLYLVTYASFRLYELLPAPVAFAIMLATVALSAFLALRQESLALAVLGTAGGFLAPILASTGSGSHVLLFGYYVVLNAGVLWLAWARAWRPLNLVGFVFTFMVATLWGVLTYQPEHYASTQPFLALFFGMYLAVALLYAHHNALKLQGYVDGTIVFGTPLIAFFLQTQLVEHLAYGVARSSLALAGVYLGLSAYLWHKSTPPSLRLLAEAFLAIGVVFATLTVPYAFDAPVTTALWALEGAAIVWVATRQARPLALWFGLALQGFAAFVYLTGALHDDPVRPVLNATFLGALLLAASGIVSARQISRHASVAAPFYSPLPALLLAWAVGVWLLGSSRELLSLIPYPYQPASYVGLLGATLGLLMVLWRTLGGIPFRKALALGYVPALALCALIQMVERVSPFSHYGWLAWGFALGIIYVFLYKFEDELDPRQALLPHAWALWLGTVVLSLEAIHRMGEQFGESTAWPLASVLFIVGTVIFTITRLGHLRTQWPFKKQADAYLQLGLGPLVAVLWLVVFGIAAGNSGAATPLPYVPVLNPLDLTNLLALLVLVYWYRKASLVQGSVLQKVSASEAALALGAAAFSWLTAALLRALHHWADIPYRLYELSSSELVQASLSIFWTAVAVLVMFWSVRKTQRDVWFAGAVLLAVVVLKLFFFDLSQLEGVRRIAAFLGVGGMLLAIGYFAPIPPSGKNSARGALEK